MSKKAKGSDGHYDGRIVHRTAVKQQRIHEYHSTAKQEWQKLEQAMVQRLLVEKAKAEVKTMAKGPEAKQSAEEVDHADHEEVEMIGKDDLVGDLDNVNVPGNQTKSARNSFAGKVWDAVTGN